MPQRNSARALAGLAILFACAATLPGCGGSDPPPSPAPSPFPPPPGPSPSPSPPGPPAPFTVTATTPAQDATGVPRDTPVRATFSVPPDPASIDSATVTLSGPEGNAIPVETALAGATLDVTTLAGRLPGDTSFTLAFAPTITDTSARGLLAPYSFRFTTTPQAWQPTAQEVGELPSFTVGTQPSIGVDDSGDVTAVWHYTAAGTPTIKAARMDSATGAWSSPVTVHADALGAGIGGSSLAVAPDGNAYFCWLQHTAGTPEVRVARWRQSNGQWTASTVLNAVANDGWSPMSPVALADRNGNVTVLTSNSQRLFATRFSPVTEQWTAPLAIEHAVPDDTVSDQTMVVDPSGNVTAAWVQRVHSDIGIYAARYDATSNAWGPAVLVAPSPSTGVFPPISMGVDDAGAVTMAWTRDDDDVAVPTEIQAAQLNPGAAQWTVPQRLDNNTTDPVGPQHAGVAVDPAGHATVVWMRSSGMEAVRRAPGGAWSAPVVVASGALDTWGNVPLVEADVAGNVAVAWLRDSRAVVAQFRVRDGQWLPHVTIDAPATGQTMLSNQPALAIDPGGTINAVWFSWQNVGAAARYAVVGNRFK